MEEDEATRYDGSTGSGRKERSHDFFQHLSSKAGNRFSVLNGTRGSHAIKRSHTCKTPLFGVLGRVFGVK